MLLHQLMHKKEQGMKGEKGNGKVCYWVDLVFCYDYFFRIRLWLRKTYEMLTLRLGMRRNTHGCQIPTLLHQETAPSPPFVFASEWNNL